MKTYKDFFESVKKGSLSKILVFEGEGYYLMRRGWEALCERFNAEYHFYILDDLKNEERREEFIKNFMESDIFSSKKVVFIIYLSRVPGYLRKILISIDKASSPNFLILIVDSDKNMRFITSYKLNNMDVYKFSELSESDSTRWITREFTRRGKLVSPRTVRFLYEISGGNLGIMRNVVDIISLAFEEKSIPSPAYIKDIVKKSYSLQEFIEVLKPGEETDLFLKKLYVADFSGYEINTFLNSIAKRLYNNKKQFLEEKTVYDVIYELVLIQKIMQTKSVNKKIYFLNEITKILLKKEVDFGISRTY